MCARGIRAVSGHEHHAAMSYDLAVWDGPRPADDAAALEVFEDLYGTFMGGASEPPTPRIRQYIEGLVARWRDVSTDDEDEDTSPWSDGPLINNASGPLFCFGMVFSKYQEVASFAAGLARMSGLVCFDPQDRRLIV
ncbi:hypothetical protein GCM10010246_04510 [Streptomyces cuspidosporus]|uniref:Uncharacterized protein n=2 Tax=Streptomyces cuspidosporus TaxID=66882 RepID=A0ABN3FAZ7_9ACTN